MSATSWLQVCRVLRGYYLSALEHAAGGVVLPGGDGGSLDPRFHLREARSRVEEALGTCLLPSLQLIPANPAVGQEIWELMSLLPYEVNITEVIFMLLHLRFTKHANRLPVWIFLPRHGIVCTASGKKTMNGSRWFWRPGRLQKYPYTFRYLTILCISIFSSYPLFSVSRSFCRIILQLDTRRILKRLAKENLKQLGRMVAKLAHANPMTVLRTIVHQVVFPIHCADNIFYPFPLCLRTVLLSEEDWFILLYYIDWGI